MSTLLNFAVFPGNQVGPLEHVIAAKAVAFGEALTDEFLEYQIQVKENAAAMAKEFVAKGYNIISGGTDNHCMLIDLRNKNISGKDAEIALGKAEITVNKNMVPFDDKSPFITSGIRVGTPAITTRGLKVEHMKAVVDFIEYATKSGNLELQLEEIYLTNGSKFNNMTLESTGIGRDLGVIIVAIKRQDGTMEFNPNFDSTINTGDTLVALGESSKLKELNELAGL